MSYESNDERIERLENQVAKLLSAQRAELRLIEADEQHQRAMNIHFLKSAVLLKNNQDALAHYFASSSMIIDEGMRRQFLDQVSRQESASEKTEKMLADLEKDSPPPLPPDEPSPPGPA